MKTPGLLEKVRSTFKEDFKGYLDLPSLEDYIKTPALKDQAGLKGGLVLAMDPSLRESFRFK